MPRLLLITAAAALCLAQTACAKDTGTEIANEAVAAASEVVDAVVTEKEVVETPVEQTAQMSGDHSEHAGEDHSGHDHGPREISPEAANMDHIFTRAPNDHVVGSTAAPNTLIVYASVTCPHCSAWFTSEWPKFKASQIDTGNTLMVFREVATPPQQVAAYGFVIADCAPADKYMDHVVYQMQNQAKIFEQLQAGQAEAVYADLFARAGLDTDAKQQACFEDRSHVERLNTSSLRLEATGASGVPAFVINGKKFEGDSTAAGLDAALNP